MAKETMTKETRTVFGLEDIAAVRFRCAGCGKELSLALGGTEALPGECPSCRSPWKPPRADAPKVVQDFLKSMRTLLGLREAIGKRVTVTFELREQTAPQPQPTAAASRLSKEQ